MTNRSALCVTGLPSDLQALIDAFDDDTEINGRYMIHKLPWLGLWAFEFDTKATVFRARLRIDDDVDVIIPPFELI
jgi:hypothetical protein